ncbi:MAG: ABC transporter permease [Planctomycetes bacterium]|nr:ABC transporter permease [Planctomycetota bacterium]
MILWKISLREIRSHKGRAFLTASSIVIGVAAVVAVNLATVAVRASFSTMQSTIAGDAALEVEAAGNATFDEALASEIAELPGVRNAAPVFRRPTVMYYGDDQRVNLTLMGVAPDRDDLMRDYDLVAGGNLTSGDEVLVDAVFAEGAKLSPGDQVRLLTSRGRPRAFTIAGLLKPTTGAAVGRMGVMFMPLETAQARFGRPDEVNLVQVMLEEGADAAAVQAAIEQDLPVGLTVHAPVAQSQMGEETMRSLQSALRLATWFAALAAVFIVANAFFMNVTQRQRQLAVMRAMGAMRGQVRLLILREATLLAVLGILAGLAVGWGGAVLLSMAMEQLFRTQLPRPDLTWRIAGWAVAFGFGMSALGAFLPARKASRVEPVEGMHEVSKADVEGVPRWFLTFGAIGFVVFGALLAANLSGYLPRYDYVLGAIIFLVFAVTLLPLALRTLSAAAAWPMRLFGRAEARLARQQLLRRQIRTVLTIGVLFVASSTGLGLASNVIDAIDDVQSWYRRVMAGDFFLRTMVFDLASWESPPLPEGVEEKVRAIEGIKYAYGVRLVSGRAAGQDVMIAAREFPTAETISQVFKDMTSEELRQRFLEGQVTIGSVLAQRTGLEAGDEIEIDTLQGPVKREIAAIINDYMGGGLVVHMERQHAAELLGVQGLDAFVIRALPEQREAVEEELRRIANEYGILLQSYAELTGEIDSMMAGVVGGLWVVMILGLVVAALGVANTLSMNVLEQTRELAMLRVVAMTRAQARRSVIAQAGMLGVIGLLPGVVVGLGLSWLINRSLMSTVGREFAFGFHPWLGIGAFAVAMVLVMAAAWIPAQRAANLEPVQALRYE